MPLTPVAVEMVVPDDHPELGTVLLEACTRAVTPATCVRSGTESASTTVAAVAIVTWSGGDHARIELKVRDHPEWSVRRLDFEPEDPAPERWRAVGFAIGTLAGSLAGGGEGSDEPAPSGSGEPSATTEPEAPTGGTAASKPAEPPSATRSSTTTKEAPRRAAPVAWKPSFPPSRGAAEDAQAVRVVPVSAERHGWMSVGAVVGPGLDHGPWRAGATLGGALTIRQAYAGVSAAFTASPHDAGLSARWLRLGTGAGLVLPGPSAPLQAVLGAEVSAERLGVGFVDDATGEHDTGSTWSGSTALTAAGIWWLSRQLAIAVGVRAGWRWGPQVEVTVRDAFFTQQPGLDLTTNAGLRIGL